MRIVLTLLTFSCENVLQLFLLHLILWIESGEHGLVFPHKKVGWRQSHKAASVLEEKADIEARRENLK